MQYLTDFGWHFHSSYPDSEKDSVIDGLEPAVVNWVKKAGTRLFSELLRSPQRNFVCCMAINPTHESDVYLLTVLTINRSKSPVCLVYVGTEDFIRSKRRQFIENYTSQIVAFGTSGTIVEREPDLQD